MMSIFLSHRPILHLYLSTDIILQIRLSYFHPTSLSFPSSFSSPFLIHNPLISYPFSLFTISPLPFPLFFLFLCFEQHHTDSFITNILLTFSSSAEANFLNRSWVCALWGLYNQYYKNIGKWNEINWTKNLSFQMWMNYWSSQKFTFCWRSNKLS